MDAGLPTAPGLSASVVGDRLLPKLPSVDKSPDVGRYEVTRADLNRTPGAMEDITRVVANLPGVVADPDLLATLFVRGGGPDELGEYLDGVPLDNPFHLGGFASVFNPMLIESADLSVGVTPARYDPSLSGALDVHYATGETEKFHAQADLSIQSAKALIDTPTGIDGLSVELSARRTFFELYFAAMQALGVVGSNFVAPELTEYFARVHYKRGRHRISLSYMRTSDGFAVLAAKGSDSSLFGFSGGVALSDILQLGSLQDVIDLGRSRELKLTAAFTHDADSTSVSGDTIFQSRVARFEALASADLTLPFSDEHRLRIGAQLRRQSYTFTGEIPDARGVPPWAALPLVSTGEPSLLVNPRIFRTVAAVYAEEMIRPWSPLALELGGRFESITHAHSIYSLRLAASVALPSTTVVKLEAGLATQQVSNPLLLDPVYGNANLLPERSRQLVLGVEQPLPFRALLRVEGYGKWLDDLVVNPDTDAGVSSLLAAGQPAYQNRGTGTARGVDLLFVGRTDLFSYGLSAGLLFADRTNPLASGVQSYAAPWDQRFTASANVSTTIFDAWLLSARATFHTGRPTTAVESFTRDDTNQRYLPVFGATNGERYPNYFDASIRAERRFTAWGIKCAWYAELLNVTNTQNVFLYVYGSGNYANSTAPTLGTFNHLPIRPFFGIRGEY